MTIHTLPDNARILIVEDDQELGNLLKEEVLDHGLEARWTGSAEEAAQIMEKWLPDMVITDLRLPGANGLDLLLKTHRDYPETPPDFLVITAFGTISKAVETLKAGAEDFLTKPLDLDHFMITVSRILRNRRLRMEISMIKSLLHDDGFHGLFGKSRAMNLLFDQIRRVAKADGPVLIVGESGTGKELVARAIHQESRHHEGPFLAVNCAGVPEHLLESEFFGHKSGAFTGAGRSRDGLFAEAHNGTLLLDEISEMPLLLQAKLLRTLQDGKIRPVGANHEQETNVRVLAATNRDLEQETKNGNFRDDLFFRLETFTLNIPPLRDRQEDLELLAGKFLQTFNVQTGKNIQGFDESSLLLLEQYPFPGNVRELKNAVERAVTFCDGKLILPRHLPSRIRKSTALIPGIKDLPTRTAWNSEHLKSLAMVEQDYIRHVLERVQGNKRKAASILGIGRRTLYRKLDQSGREEQDG
ncbi:sigma-54-dependent transcriptional regulator [Desulfonatronovibrio hydrogenovorans]|uniref:sigma-54-dependent transcriptional regulator n=1 Tax=Desulfonatronovibrio hydrogenovorans TaxID=53245 RepID=UPI00048D0DA1|nr:sigma-54 dependent transcriptional regulator [Desulfonatronovibrio hydrogenovorans]